MIWYEFYDDGNILVTAITEPPIILKFEEDEGE